MPSNVYLPSDLHYHEDLEREREETRYELALKRITVDEVLSEVDSLIARESGFRKHPLHALATCCTTAGFGAVASAPPWPSTSPPCTKS
jgi:hypothetical protein